MSGPPYPHPNPTPGSNAIGRFAIGISPVGDIPPFDVWTTIISQYANGAVLPQLCQNMALYIDPTRDFDAFFDTVWNVITAQGLGLDIWGRIVGVTRVIQLAAPGQSFFGFNESGDPVQRTGFGQGPFFSGQALTNNFTLSDDAFRTLILAKALANICDGSIPAINQILINLFPGQGNCYVIDNGDMTMVYKFDFVLSATQSAIIQSGVLPRPSGVSTSIVSQ